MTFFVPHSPSGAVLSRSQRISERRPQAASAIKSIDNAVKSYPYGAKIDNVLNHYHFLAKADVESFFKVYLERRHGCVPDVEYVNYHVRCTMNAYHDSASEDKYRVDRAFGQVTDEIVAAIRKNSVDRVPLLQFILGPTGAGKTVFSKYIFTVCMHRFWSNGIIPSRIEYSKIGTNRHSSDLSSGEFYLYVRMCLFRDFIIFLFLAGQVSKQEREGLIEQSSTFHDLTRALRKLEVLCKDLVLDGNSVNLSTSLRSDIQAIWTDVPSSERDAFLYLGAEKLHLKFVISFDGFDSVRIEDFLFHTRPPAPIQYLTNMLKELHEKRGPGKLFSRALEAHFLVYLRDTTFERLRSDLLTSVGGGIKLPISWIVPPKYEMLVQNVSNYVSDDGSERAALASKFTNELFARFDEAIFRGLDLNAREHLGFVFGSNARRMNQHIRQTLLSMLNRASYNERFDFERKTSGIALGTVWRALVDGYGPSQLPRYVLFEDLFLGDTRQLVPKLRLDPIQIREKLTHNSIEAAISIIDDVDETSSIFGCLLNYAVPGYVSSGKERCPAMLVLVRMMQYIAHNPRCRAGEVLGFVRDIGYTWKTRLLEFCLYVLIRSEMIKWDATTLGRFITDVPLYITTRGIISISRILPSISYLSEAIITCLHEDRDVTKNLRGRNGDPSVWVIDCVYNALIAIELIREVEAVECAFAAGRQKDFVKYLMTESLTADVLNEAKPILVAAFARARSPLADSAVQRWEENERRLNDLRARRFPGLPSAQALKEWRS